MIPRLMHSSPSGAVVFLRVYNKSEFIMARGQCALFHKSDEQGSSTVASTRRLRLLRRTLLREELCGPGSGVTGEMVNHPSERQVRYEGLEPPRLALLLRECISAAVLLRALICGPLVFIVLENRRAVKVAAVMSWLHRPLPLS